MQVEAPGVIKDVGLHASEVKVTGRPPVTVMVPPVPVIGMAPPVAEAAIGFVTAIEVLLVTVGESVTFTMAATPFETTLALIPVSRHV